MLLLNTVERPYTHLRRCQSEEIVNITGSIIKYISEGEKEAETELESAAYEIWTEENKDDAVAGELFYGPPESSGRQENVGIFLLTRPLLGPKWCLS